MSIKPKHDHEANKKRDTLTWLEDTGPDYPDLGIQRGDLRSGRATPTPLKKKEDA